MVKCPACGEENPPKFRLCGYCGAALPSSAPPPAAGAVWMVRKTVTFLFCDLKGSTQLGERLDPESFHEVKERYFAAMSAQIVRHGGTIEKYIGDAIMAVFGVPRAREDDALRAVRAALGMKAALAELNIELRTRYGVTLANRTGVNTGEVVANQDPRADQKLATGDAVNTAARLEQAASENEIYIGESTFRLVRDAVSVQNVPALELKGKAEPVIAFRLLAIHGEAGLARRHDRPLAGRSQELARLGENFLVVTREARVRLVTVVGDAGMGKSRLVRELMDSLSGNARVLTGRCLAYGEGITYWPLMMAVREAAGIDPQAPPDEALALLRAVTGDEEVSERLAFAIGLSSEAYPLHEINWAARRFFEHLAAANPLLLVIDDIHWGESALLELLGHLAQSAAGVPMLILCTGRHELLERHPEWGQKPGSELLQLEPLSVEAATDLVQHLLGDAKLPTDLVERIVAAAGGNPLYAEQMLLMLVDRGLLMRVDGRWASHITSDRIEVPPTIQALLEARVDQLHLGERATVEPAAVIGMEFGQQALESVAPDRARSDLPANLDGLVRKQLIWSAASRPGDTAYRFHHHLVHDTVYQSMTKRARANLHRAFVQWSDSHQADRALELCEVLGYHLEQAHRYLKDLGPLDEIGLALGRDGARRLASAGRRAAERGDAHAAASLLRRSTALLPADDPTRLALLPELGDVLTDLAEFDEAARVLEEARDRAVRLGDRRTEGAATLFATLMRLYSGQQQQDNWSAEARRVAEEWIPPLEAMQAHHELAIAWRLLVMVHGIAGRYEETGRAAVQAIAHARAGGHERLALRTATAQATVALYGATPVREAMAQVQALIGAGLRDRQIESALKVQLAQLLAMDGQGKAARALIQQSRSTLEDRGLGVYAASYGIDLARVALRGDDLSGVAEEVEADCRFLAEKGETYFLSTMKALLGRIELEQGRLEEALAHAAGAEAATAADDVESSALWRMVRAGVWARQGRTEAEAMAREALAYARKTESPMLKAEALCNLAQVLRQGRADADWRAPLQEALSLLSRKGDRASWQRWNDWATRAGRA